MPVLPDRPRSGRSVVSPGVAPASRPASVTRASRPVRRLTSRAYWSADVVETAIRPMRLVPVDGAATAGGGARGGPPPRRDLPAGRVVGGDAADGGVGALERGRAPRGGGLVVLRDRAG